MENKTMLNVTKDSTVEQVVSAIKAEHVRLTDAYRDIADRKASLKLAEDQLKADAADLIDHERSGSITLEGSKDGNWTVRAVWQGMLTSRKTVFAFAVRAANVWR